MVMLVVAVVVVVMMVKGMVEVDGFVLSVVERESVVVAAVAMLIAVGVVAVGVVALGEFTVVVAGLITLV